MEVAPASQETLTACPCCSFRFDSKTASDSGASKSDRTHFLTQMTWDDVAAKLLESSLLLTALELYMELCECGSSQTSQSANHRSSLSRTATHELPRLRAFFSNPANFENSSAPTPALTPASKHQLQPPRTFTALSSGQNATNGKLVRSGSQATLDSFDWARYSDDSDQPNEERIAVLEYELRKAHDAIRSLREELTRSAQLGTDSKADRLPDSGVDSSAPSANSASAFQSSAAMPKSSNGPPIRRQAAAPDSFSQIPSLDAQPALPHERRALNFLVHEYLLRNNHRYTAVAFAEEKENEQQDFDSWDDVGINVARPPDLCTLLRQYWFSISAAQQRRPRTSMSSEGAESAGAGGGGGGGGVRVTASTQSHRELHPSPAGCSSPLKSAAGVASGDNNTLVVAASPEDKRDAEELSQTPTSLSLSPSIGNRLSRAASADTACQVELLRAREFERLAEELAESNRLRLSYEEKLLAQSIELMRAHNMQQTTATGDGSTPHSDADSTDGQVLAAPPSTSSSSSGGVMGRLREQLAQHSASSGGKNAVASGFASLFAKKNKS